MEFPLLDRYLLENSPSKEEVVAALLRERPQAPGATPFYEGLKILGARTPELSLIALRLVLAGKKADDVSVKALRALVDRVRAGDSDAGDAREAYAQALR